MFNLIENTGFCCEQQSNGAAAAANEAEYTKMANNPKISYETRSRATKEAERLASSREGRGAKGVATRKKNLGRRIHEGKKATMMEALNSGYLERPVSRGKQRRAAEAAAAAGAKKTRGRKTATKSATKPASGRKKKAAAVGNPFDASNL